MTPISQGSLHPEQVEPLASLGTKVGILLALPLSSSHGQGFGQWTTAGDFEQASQLGLGLGHRSAAPARVGLLIRLRHPPEWIITPARKFRILAHTNPTRQRGL